MLLGRKENVVIIEVSFFPQKEKYFIAFTDFEERYLI
jgi:hypothetical protein